MSIKIKYQQFSLCAFFLLLHSFIGIAQSKSANPNQLVGDSALCTYQFTNSKFDNVMSSLLISVGPYKGIIDTSNFYPTIVFPKGYGIQNLLKKDRVFYTDTPGNNRRLLKSKEGDFRLPFFSGCNSISFFSAYIYRLESLDYDNPIRKFSLHHCTSNSIKLSSDSLDLTFANSYANSLTIYSSKIDNIDMDFSYLDTLIFLLDTMRTVPQLGLNKNPSLLVMEDCTFNFPEQLWNLDMLINSNDKRKPHLRLWKVDLSRLKFEYSNFILDPYGLSFQQIESRYNGLKEQYKKLGMTESYQLADIDLIKATNHHKGGLFVIFDWINRSWWNYGYDKSKVIVNSIYLFLGFLILNLIIGLKRLSNYAYTMPSYYDISNTIGEQKNIIRKAAYRFIYTFMYTSLVFWGINLDKKELRYKNVRYLCYILLQYLAGIICLAYIAAYILSK